MPLRMPGRAATAGAYECTRFPRLSHRLARGRHGLGRAALRNLEAPLHSGACQEGCEGPRHLRELADADEIAGLVVTDEVANPGKRGDVGDGAAIAHDPRAAGEPPVEHGEEPSRLCDVTVARALVLEIPAGEFV